MHHFLSSCQQFRIFNQNLGHLQKLTFSVFLDLVDENQKPRADIADHNVCEKIIEVTETERTRREYEDSIKRRHNRLMEFVDTHVKDDQIKKYIRVKAFAKGTV